MQDINPQNDDQKKLQFWKAKRLEDMTFGEWESLCDGCAKCCLIKLIDAKTGKVHFTNVVCRYLDLDTCKCTVYEDRHKYVPDCVELTLKIVREANWLPNSCAYRKIARGENLSWWHPLISGNPQSMLIAGASIKGKVVSESEIEDNDLEDMVVDWFD